MVKHFYIWRSISNTRDGLPQPPQLLNVFRIAPRLWRLAVSLRRSGSEPPDRRRQPPR